MLSPITLLTEEGSAAFKPPITLLTLTGAGPPPPDAPAVASCGMVMVKSTCTPPPLDSNRVPDVTSASAQIGRSRRCRLLAEASDNSTPIQLPGRPVMLERPEPTAAAASSL
jgi:hypothetical protein